MALGHNRSIPDIFSDIIHQVTRLLRSEAALARAEMANKISQVGRALGLIIGGAVLLIPALVILLEAAVEALREAGIIEQPWAASLIVGGGVLLVGLILLMVGISRLKAKRFVPEKTIAQLQRDAAVAKHQMRNEHAPIDRAA